MRKTSIFTFGLVTSVLMIGLPQLLFSAPSHSYVVASGRPSQATSVDSSKKITTTAKKETIEEKVDQLKRQLAALTQNRDNPRGTSNWLKIFKLSGMINIDAYDETKPEFGVGHARADKISLATTLLNVDADLNDWVQGHIGFFYSDTPTRYYLKHDASTTGVQVDEAYGQIANFRKMPFYLRAGQLYLPFGRYRRYPITKTLTQDLTETRATAAEIGFVDSCGLYGAVYAFNGLKKITRSNRDAINNYGAALGYRNANHAVIFDLGAGYLGNMSDVGQISYNLANSEYTKRVGALDFYGSAFAGPFSFEADYVTALTVFDQADFQWQPRLGTTSGAKPRAANFNAGYTFKLKNHPSKIEVSYQLSREAHNVNGATHAMALPKQRLSAVFGGEVFKNTIVALEYCRDKDYPRSNGGTNAYDNVLTLRLTLLLM